MQLYWYIPGREGKGMERKPTPPLQGNFHTNLTVCARGYIDIAVLERGCASLSPTDRWKENHIASDLPEVAQSEVERGGEPNSTPFQALLNPPAPMYIAKVRTQILWKRIA